MNKTYVLALVALSTVAGANLAAAASAVQTQVQGTAVLKRPIVLPSFYRFDCKALGSPVEFPNDLFIRNIANFATPAGLKIRWTLPAYSKAGTAVLPALAPGKGTYLSGVIPGIGAGTPCTVKTL